MDFKIACALNLSPELVWFSRQSYDEELSSSPSSDGGSDGWPRHCRGYFPEMPHDLGSDGTRSPGRDGDCSDGELGTECIGDEVYYRLFGLEPDIRDSRGLYGYPEDDCRSASPVYGLSPLPARHAVSPRHLPSPASPPPGGKSSSPASASLLEAVSYPSSPERRGPSSRPELMVATSPVRMETLLLPVSSAPKVLTVQWE